LNRNKNQPRVCSSPSPCSLWVVRVSCVECCAEGIDICEGSMFEAWDIRLLNDELNFGNESYCYCVCEICWLNLIKIVIDEFKCIWWMHSRYCTNDYNSCVYYKCEVSFAFLHSSLLCIRLLY
jgi:hypothetical protein